MRLWQVWLGLVWLCVGFVCASPVLRLERLAILEAVL